MAGKNQTGRCIELKEGKSARAEHGPGVLFHCRSAILEGVLCLGNEVSRQFWQDDGAAKQVREVGAEVSLVCQVLAGQRELPRFGLIPQRHVDQRVSGQNDAV